MRKTIEISQIGLTQFPSRSGLKPLLPCDNGRNSVILRKSYQTALNFIKLLFVFPMLIVGCSGNPLEETSDFPARD